MLTNYLPWIWYFSYALPIYAGIYTPSYLADIDIIQYIIQLSHLRLLKANETFKNIQVIMGVWLQSRAWIDTMCIKFHLIPKPQFFSTPGY